MCEKMVKAIILDYDGVIVDSFLTVYETYRQICAKMSLKIPSSPSEFRSIYGRNSNEYFENMGLNQSVTKAVRTLFKQEIVNKNPPPFKGIKNVLNELNKSYLLIILSSSYETELNAKLKKYGLFGFFNMVIGRKSPEENFSKSEHIKEILNKYSFSTDEVILIGDRDVDYIAAKNAGIKNTLLVDYGWGYDKSFFPGQDVEIKAPNDILVAVNTVRSKSSS